METVLASLSGGGNAVVTYIIDAIVRIVAILICITFHELAHGYAAYLLGDTTAKSQGRLSINPLAHIDPIGLLCMFIAGIGWAKPVPVNPGQFRMKNKKLGMAITALAGPLTNFVMSFICLLIYVPVLLLTNNAFAVALCDILQAIALMGIGLGVFNLIPIPPLDGSKVLMAFLPYRVNAWIWRNEGYIRFAFLILVFFRTFNGIISAGMGFILNKMIGWVVAIFTGIGVLS